MAQSIAGSIKHILISPLVYRVYIISNGYSNIISRKDCSEYKDLNWGNNGIGNRWCKKLFNYTVIYKGNGNNKCYSENINDKIPEDKLEKILGLNERRNYWYFCSFI